jgi:hypothetical protein
MTTSKGIKLQETRDLTWKPPQHEREKPRAPASKNSLYRESGYNANGGGLQEENESISNGKP